MTAETRTETASERFERLAEAHFRETGRYAPGKDVAGAIAGTMDDYTARVDAWRAWLRQLPTPEQPR